MPEGLAKYGKAEGVLEGSCKGQRYDYTLQRE